MYVNDWMPFLLLMKDVELVKIQNIILSHTKFTFVYVHRHFHNCTLVLGWRMKKLFDLLVDHYNITQ